MNFQVFIHIRWSSEITSAPKILNIQGQHMCLKIKSVYIALTVRDKLTDLQNTMSKIISMTFSTSPEQKAVKHLW